MGLLAWLLELSFSYLFFRGRSPLLLANSQFRSLSEAAAIR